MDNKLREPSKPVAWVKADRNIAENWSCTDPESVISTEGWHSDYNPVYSQEYVSALLAELEAKEREIDAANARVDVMCAKAMNLTERAETAEKNMELHFKAIEAERGLYRLERGASRYRIAELEAKLATPVRLLGKMLVHDWEHRVERQAAFEHRKTAWDARLEEDKKAIRAAGFTFTVEGDE
jgi:hypothetical protein